MKTTTDIGIEAVRTKEIERESAIEIKMN